MKNFKKLIIGCIFGITALSGVACSPRSKAMDYLKDKTGLFAVIQTKQGDIAVELFYKDTPLTVVNFVALAEGKMDAANGKPFYDGLKFHRVISLANGDEQDFMIQGGDPKGNGTGGPGYKFADEIVEKYTFTEPGLLAMANSGPGTNGSQFFITIVPTEWLNGRHTIFGKVVYGQEIVNKTKQDEVIKSIKIVRNGDEAKAFKADQVEFDRLVKEIEDSKFAKVTEGCTKSPEGIYFKIEEEGTGAQIGNHKNVVCDYIGYTIEGVAFDASRGFHPQGHDPLEFEVGGGMMIPGFDKMVSQMKVGEVRTMVIPPELAYGASGIPQAGIAPNSYICFTVKLVEVK